MKPAYKTFGFWVSTLVAVLGILLASEALPENVAQIVAGAIAVLSGGTSAAKLKSLPKGIEQFPPAG